MDSLASRVAARYVDAGIFEPPPRLFEAVKSWMFATFAAHALARAELLLEKWRPLAVEGGNGLKVKERLEEVRHRCIEDMTQFYEDMASDPGNVPPFTDTYDMSVPQDPAYARFKIVLEWDGESLAVYESKGTSGKKVSEFWQLSDLDDDLPEILKPFNSVIKWARVDVEMEGVKKRIVDAASLKRAASKYASKGRLIKTSAKTTIKVDVRGWKYLRPEEEADAAAVVASKLPEITCILFFDAHANRGGQWHIGKRTLQVDTRSAMVDSDTGFEHALSEIDRITYHEAQHVGQDVLRMIRGLKNDAGLPPTSIRVPETPGQKKRPEHALRDVEFYTDLQNEVRHFRNKLRLIPVPDWRAAARIFMDDPKGADVRTQDTKVLALLRSEYFQTLHKKAPDKWRKAVSEFTKAIEPYLRAGGV